MSNIELFFIVVALLTLIAIFFPSLLPNFIKKPFAYIKSKIGFSKSTVDELELYIEGNKLVDKPFDNNTYCHKGELYFLESEVNGPTRFKIRFTLKNVSKETFQLLNHMYIFGDDKKLVVPCKIEEAEFETSTVVGRYNKPTPTGDVETIYKNAKAYKTIPLKQVQMSGTDSSHGLKLQYRIEKEFDPIPPNAPDNLDIIFTLTNKLEEKIKVPFSFRIHQDAIQYDFPFYVEIGP